MICGALNRLIVIDSPFVSECPPVSCTRTVNVDVVAGKSGVPVIAPFVAFKFRPAGSVPAEMLQVRVPDPPVACKVWL